MLLVNGGTVESGKYAGIRDGKITQADRKVWNDFKKGYRELKKKYNI